MGKFSLPGLGDVRRAMFPALFAPLVAFAVNWGFPTPSLADGKLFPPRSYKGSLEEQSQEAIIIFTHDPLVEQSGFEHVIIKLSVTGNVDNFAWVVPFPAKPKVEQEDAKLFAELFGYVQARSVRHGRSGGGDYKTKTEPGAAKSPVEVLSRETVGSYDVAIVRENEGGALNRWLASEGFRTVEDGEDVLEFYRAKGYVMATTSTSTASSGGDSTWCSATSTARSARRTPESCGRSPPRTRT